MNTEPLIEIAMEQYPEANRMAVENFCFSASTDKTTNSMNIQQDIRLYGWHIHTVRAIRSVLLSEGKI